MVSYILACGLVKKQTVQKTQIAVRLITGATVLFSPDILAVINKCRLFGQLRDITANEKHNDAYENYKMRTSSAHTFGRFLSQLR